MPLVSKTFNAHAISKLVSTTSNTTNAPIQDALTLGVIRSGAALEAHREFEVPARLPTCFSRLVFSPPAKVVSSLAPAAQYVHFSPGRRMLQAQMLYGSNGLAVRLPSATSTPKHFSYWYQYYVMMYVQST